MYGIATYGSKMFNLAGARPLTYVGTMDVPITLGKNNNASQSFASVCPTGSTLIAIPDNVSCPLRPSVSNVLDYRGLVISVDNAARSVSLNLNLDYTGVNYSFAGAPSERPSKVNVFCIYAEASIDGYGIKVIGGGQFPYVVDSRYGMFLSYKWEGNFTGNLTLPVADNAIVFCSWNNPDVAIVYDTASKTLKGYYNGGSQSGISIYLRVCAFSIRVPVMPAWGIAIYGADRRVSFTSEETPMLYRGQINTPNSGNAPTYFSDADQAQGPMIPVFRIGGRLATGVWFHLGIRRTGNAVVGGGTNIVATGDTSGRNYDTISYDSKPIPFIWASDYF